MSKAHDPKTERPAYCPFCGAPTERYEWCGMCNDLQVHGYPFTDRDLDNKGLKT